MEAYGEDTYNAFCDTDETYHGGVAPPPVEKAWLLEPVRCSPQPWHDVESIFWNFVSTLIRIVPCGAAYSRSSRFRETLEMLEGEVLQDQPRRDPRNAIVDWYNEYAFEEALHEELWGIGLDTLLVALANQVLPEYALLTSSPPVEHLHEAFRRILLSYIVESDRDADRQIALDRRLLRVARPLVRTPASQNSRGSEVFCDGEESTSDPEHVRLAITFPLIAVGDLEINETLC